MIKVFPNNNINICKLLPFHHKVRTSGSYPDMLFYKISLLKAKCRPDQVGILINAVFSLALYRGYCR